jgi:ribonuclease T1
VSRRLRLIWIILATLLWLPLAPSLSHGAPPAQGGLSVIAIAELPAEARDTLRAIKQGGPFAYPRDGVVFNNFEHVLPQRPRGYYHEYTVATPDVQNRGVRRIIRGASREYYYTADHYQTFKRILE